LIVSTSAEFVAVFKALRGMLQRHAGKLSVAEDTPKRFCLEGGSRPKHKKAMPIAWVQVRKAYVSFHHMGVYARPELLRNVSKALRARMQGKSCFNFMSIDQALVDELEELTVRGFDAFRKAGFMP
jgi:hypothetical protein